jgi:hypothetical protein
LITSGVAKLEENGTTADRIKDQVSKKDKAGQSFKKSFETYTSKMYMLLRSPVLWLDARTVAVAK